METEGSRRRSRVLTVENGLQFYSRANTDHEETIRPHERSCERRDLMTINITELIRDYRMMKREIERLQRIIYGTIQPMRSWGVALYGIEASMPRGSKGKSQAELRDMDI